MLCNQKRELRGDPVVLAAHARHGEHLAVVVFALVFGLALNREVLFRTEEGLGDCGHSPSTTIAQTLKIAALPLWDPGKVSMHMEYAALFEPAEEGGFVITIPDFGWGFSQGDTEVEARQMAAALLQTLVQERIRKRETLPRPTRRRGSQYRFVRLSALQCAKAELYMAFLASGMRKAELARRLGIPKTNVDRLFDLDNHSRIGQIEAAFAVLGKRIALEVRDAA